MVSVDHLEASFCAWGAVDENVQTPGIEIVAKPAYNPASAFFLPSAHKNGRTPIYQLTHVLLHTEMEFQAGWVSIT